MTIDLGPTPEQIATMRTNVMTRITPDRSSAPQKPHRRTGAVVLTSGAIAAALIIAGVLVPSGGASGGASAQAAEFLDSAAVATIDTADPVVGPGQYLRISTHAASGVTDGTRESPRWMAPTSEVLYIPADRTDTWVWERRNLPPTIFFGNSRDLALDAYEGLKDDPDLNGVLRASEGAFYGSPEVGADLSELPRDPEALRDFFYRDYTGGSSSIDEDVWVRITDLLRTGEVPGDLRAALYRTIALLPEVTILANEATLDGRTGVALGRTEPARGSQSREEIVIDPDTGLLIGERTVTLTDLEDIPAGTVIRWSSIETTVVDAAP